MYGEGIYVQTKKEFTGTFGSNTLSLVINTKKPFPFYDNNGKLNKLWLTIRDKHANTKKFYWADVAKEEFRDEIKKLGYDSIKTEEGGGNVYYILFNPEQTHILGSKQDIEEFKKYTEKNIKENMSSFKIFSKKWWKENLDLNESPPNDFENDDNQQYVEDNLSALNKAALVFNFPVEDMQLAFNGASSLVLMDDVWSKLENSNSHNIQTLGQALLYAKENKIDPVPYLEAIKNMESLPKPLVLKYDTDKYYLINGEFVLSLQKALNMTPDILQATINVKIKEDGGQEDEINLVNEFIRYVKENLGLVQTPKIEFSDDTDHVKEQCSFGYFSPDLNVIWVYAGDRNMADIFRTLAHELVHRKQEEDGKINYESGKTGSDIENEANAKAGVLLRDFGKKHNDIYDTPIKKFIKNGLSEVKIQKPIPNALKLLEQIKTQIEQTEDKATKTALAIKAAELVLPIYEYYYPNNDRAHKAIEAAKSGNANADDYYSADSAADCAAAAAYAAANASDYAATNAVINAIKATKLHFKLDEVKIQIKAPNNLAKLEQIKDEMSQTKDEATLKALSIKAVELVLPIWYYYYPNDKRVKNTIEAAKRGEIDDEGASEAGNDIVDNNTPGAYDVARAADYAASDVHGNSEAAAYVTIYNAIEATKSHFNLKEVKIQQPINYKKAYGEVHSYGEMKNWEDKNGTLPSHFLVDRTNNTVLAGFQDYNIPKWAWDLHGNDNIPPTENNKFALASKSSITNPPPYLNTPNIDVTNPSSWSNISKVKQYIKNLSEVKIQNPVVDLDQKIKDISNDINDQIEHIYFIGDDTNDLNDQMDNIARTHNWDYTTESLKNMNVKNKIELYRDLENLQEKFK